jgi:site-specific DNA-cytosine methylase
MKVIDLFCGAGGFSEGFRQAGYEIVLGVDTWSDAIESFKVNQKSDGWIRDIRDITILPDCDVIIGSPPCQCFSVANYKRRNNNGNNLDIQGLELVHEFERIIKLNKPKYWVWENVEPIKKFYRQAFIINSFDVGVPQKRRRAFVANFSFFRSTYSEGELTQIYGYTGAKADNAGNMAHSHHGRSKTVTTYRIRDLETDKYLTMEKVKTLMGFPKEYFLYGGVTSQQTQLGNAVCPPVAKVIAEGLTSQL